MRTLLLYRNKVSCSIILLSLLMITGQYLFGQPVAEYAAFKNTVEESRNPLPAAHQLELTLQNLPLSGRRTLKINAFINGGEVINIAETSVAPGQEKIILNYTLRNDQYYGIGEIVISDAGAFPVIISAGQQKLKLHISPDNLSQYTPPASTPDLFLLANFLKIYKGYENMYRHYLDIMISPWGRFTSDTSVYTAFLKDYISFRNQFNLFFRYAKTEHPGTYIADHLACMFVQPEVQNFTAARDVYFKNWNFNDSTLLNNPLLDRQLDLYRLITQLPFMADPDKATDGLFAFVKGYHWGSSQVTDHITQNWIINLFQENKNGDNDKTIEHFYQRWLRNETESCNEEAGGKEVFQKAFYKRLGNIGKMGTGMLFPAVSGYTKDGAKSLLQNELGKKEFTILFVWSSSCSHCEEYAPLLEALAQKHKDRLQVFAYSIDKKETENDWVKKILRRKGFSNWKDVAETGDMSSAGISNIFYTGTPSVFLIDKSGKLISKDSNPEALSSLILQKKK